MIYGLLGKTLSHSLSKTIHTLLGGYDYKYFEVEESGLDLFFKNKEFDFLNVTIPYKKEALRYCDELSDTAKRLCNVNTIIKRADGSLFGDNTDYYGFLYTVKSLNINASGKKAIILGSGGAALTAKAVLCDLGAKCVIISRSGENNYQNLHLHYDAGIIVNATPVGMYPNAVSSFIDLYKFTSVDAVIDMIYNPLKTRLIYDAQRLSVKNTNGLYMLCAQGARSAELFTGKKISDDLIKKAIETCEKELKNIVIIGMPGVGKTSLGKRLADALDLSFFDSDEYIFKKQKKSPEEIITSLGEKAFRGYESEAVKELTMRKKCVISLGGGAVLKEENRYFISQNSVIIFINSAPELLETKGRPLSFCTDEVLKMYKTRLPIYRELCDIEIKRRDTIEDTLNSLLTEIKRCGF